MDKATEKHRLQVVIPFHQPLKASRDDLADAWGRVYEPVLKAIEAADGAKFMLHFSGHLLDYLAKNNEEVLFRLKALVTAQRAEVLGGLFYGSIPALLSETDIRGQVEMSAEFWESYLGSSPRGMWLTELAWCRELPRLFTDTGMEYVYASSSQLTRPHALDRGIAVVERGDERLTTFVLDEVLSSALPRRPVQEWCEALADRARSRYGAVTNVWVRAESLGFEPGTKAWCIDGGWLSDWMSALAEGRGGVETHLAHALVSELPLALPVTVGERVATELKPLAAREGELTWSDFPCQLPEVDLLQRRMLAVSDKLSDAVATMEDEELESEWSDKLATVQRHLFAAQAPEAYWRGVNAGFSDPATRRAAMQKLVRADEMLDSLSQEGEQWLSVEEGDSDADLQDEAFVSTAQLAAWVAPAYGGAILALDDRHHGDTLLDVGVRRAETFFSAMTDAPLASGKEAHDVPPPRGDGLVRAQEDLPQGVDRRPLNGIREHLFAADAKSEQLLLDTPAQLGSHPLAWKVLNQEVLEEGEPHFRLELEHCGATAASDEQLGWKKEIVIPETGSSLSLKHQLSPANGGKWIMATDLPFYLCDAPHQVFVGKKPAKPGDVLRNVDSLRVVAGDRAISVSLQPAVDIHWRSLQASIRDADGYRVVDQGVHLVSALSVADSVEHEIEIVLDSADKS